MKKRVQDPKIQRNRKENIQGRTSFKIPYEKSKSKNHKEKDHPLINIMEKSNIV